MVPTSSIHLPPYFWILLQKIPQNKLNILIVLRQCGRDLSFSQQLREPCSKAIWKCPEPEHHLPGRWSTCSTPHRLVEKPAVVFHSSRDSAMIALAAIRAAPPRSCPGPFPLRPHRRFCPCSRCAAIAPLFCDARVTPGAPTEKCKRARGLGDRSPREEIALGIRGRTRGTEGG
jgi:hypothetical protein